MDLVRRTASAPPGANVGQRKQVHEVSTNIRNQLHHGSTGKQVSESTMDTAVTTREETSSSSSSQSSDWFESVKKRRETKGSLHQRLWHMLSKRKNSCSWKSQKRDLEAAIAAEMLEEEMVDGDEFLIAFEDEPSAISTSTGRATVLVSNTCDDSRKRKSMNEGRNCHKGDDAIRERTLKETPRESINVFQQELSTFSRTLYEEEPNNKPTKHQILLWERAKRNFKESRNDIVLDQPLPNVPPPSKSHHNKTIHTRTTPVAPIYYALPKLSVLKDMLKGKEFYSNCMSQEAKELLAALKARDDLASLTDLIQQISTMMDSSSFFAPQEDARSADDDKLLASSSFGSCIDHLVRPLNIVDKQVAGLTADTTPSVDADDWVDDRITI